MSTLEDAANKMVKNLEASSGISLQDWIDKVEASGKTRHREIIDFLKASEKLTHGYANLIAFKWKDFKNGGPATDSQLVVSQYANKDTLKEIYDQLIREIKKFGSDVEIAPKKTYVSLRRNKQFALIQPSTLTRLDVGINLKGVPPTSRLELSGSFNAMVSHRVRLNSKEEVNKELIEWLKEAYDRA